MRQAFRVWWGRPFSYARIRRFGDVLLDLAFLRRSIALATLVIGVASLAILPSVVGPSGTVARLLFLLPVVGSVPVAVLWWRGPWPSGRASLLFAAYAAGSIGFALQLYSDPGGAMAGTVLLITVGVYVSLVHHPAVILAHVAWSVLVVSVLLVRTVLADGDVALAVSTWLALLTGLAGVPVMLYGAWSPLRATAWDAMSDPLTGVLNRRGLLACMQRVRLAGPGQDLAVAMVDLDRFKAINDQEGHAAGDAVLRSVASELLRSSDSTALCARVGGEEFVVVFAAEQGAVRGGEIGDHLTRAVRDRPGPWAVTASVGVWVGPPPSSSRRAEVDRWLEEAVGLADSAMYRAKRRGGDQLELHASGRGG